MTNDNCFLTERIMTLEKDMDSMARANDEYSDSVPSEFIKCTNEYIERIADFVFHTRVFREEMQKLTGKIL